MASMRDDSATLTPPAKDPEAEIARVMLGIGNVAWSGRTSKSLWPIIATR